jgi:O-6-methylguanine DNA methyltransferase
LAHDTSGDTLHAGRISTQLGPMVALVDTGGALVYLDFDDKTGPTQAPPEAAGNWRGFAVTWDTPRVTHVAAELMAYFAGERTEFTLAVAPVGNEFHRQVWGELQRMPYGETISYGELARRVGRSGAARAVGRANGLNPVSIVIPCHRVIGADGRLTGYSGGIERKAALLALERATTPKGQASLPLDVAPGRVRRVK